MNKKHQQNIHDGSTLHDFLESEGLLEECTAIALKRVLSWQLSKAMKKQGVSKKRMAAEMETSRAQLDRILDPENVGVSLDSISRAAQALGKRVALEILDSPQGRKTAKAPGRKKGRAA